MQLRYLIMMPVSTHNYYDITNIIHFANKETANYFIFLFFLLFSFLLRKFTEKRFSKSVFGSQKKEKEKDSLIFFHTTHLLCVIDELITQDARNIWLLL